MAPSSEGRWGGVPVRGGAAPGPGAGWGSGLGAHWGFGSRLRLAARGSRLAGFGSGGAGPRGARVVDASS
ncbi:hypothetical protein GCM10027168_06290 [Streptomyces capparidis]